MALPALRIPFKFLSLVESPFLFWLFPPLLPHFLPFPSVHSLHSKQNAQFPYVRGCFMPLGLPTYCSFSYSDPADTYLLFKNYFRNYYFQEAFSDPIA